MLQFGYDSVERWEQEWLRLKYDPTTRAAPFIERGAMDDDAAYSVTQAQFNTLHDILTAFLLGRIEAGALKTFILQARVREARR
jgi:hypothetical protein